MPNAWLRLRDRITEPKEEPRTLYLSTNSKTGHSINTPIPLTCRPTAACSKYCYGVTGPISMSMALVRQTQNYFRFEALAKAPQAEVNQEADRIAGGVLYADQDWLRVFGVGDLQKGSVRFINALAKRHPKLTLWVATRQFTLAQGLVKAKNLHVMLSSDATTRPRDWEALRKLAMTRGPNTFIAYVQQSPEDRPPADVKVIFAEHKPGGNRGSWTVSDADPRTCPATIRGGEVHNDACARCRYCFDAKQRSTKKPIARHRLTVL